MIEHSGWDEERLRTACDGDLVPWSELMQIAGMIEFEDAAENWRLCLSHMLNVRVDVWRSGHREAVGQVLQDLYDDDDMGLALARTMLAQAGLGLVQRKASRKDFWVAVPNQNPLTRKLFEGSKWAGDVGAGVWAGALRQSPRGTLHDVAKARVNGDKQSTTLISLEGLYGENGIMTDEEPDG